MVCGSTQLTGTQRTERASGQGFISVVGWLDENKVCMYHRETDRRRKRWKVRERGQERRRTMTRRSDRTMKERQKRRESESKDNRWKRK